MNKEKSQEAHFDKHKNPLKNTKSETIIYKQKTVGREQKSR